MVDRIVPAMTGGLEQVAARIGVRDDAAVFTEAFTQWVIEDDFAGPRPRWEAAGAQFVTDVAPTRRPSCACSMARIRRSPISA